MRTHRLALLTATPLLVLAAVALADDPPPRGPTTAATTTAAPTTAPSATPVRPPALPVTRYVLENGLEVIVHEDHRAPLVTVNIWYHVGGKDEPQGRNGFAHLFEHLMFQGSRHVPEDTYFRFLEQAGATGINGTTGDDRTNYFETVPVNQLELALWLESDRMAFLLDHVNQETLDSQRNVVLNERRQRYENVPYGNLSRFMREALYPTDHPYYRLPIGTPEDLNNATLEDVRQFFRTWYVPNNATLVIAGDVQPDAVRPLVEKYFGPIVRGADVPRRAAPPAVQLSAERRVEIEAGVELPRVSIEWPSPAFFQPGDAELDLVGNVLTNGRSSRLYKRLVQEMQIAQDVGAAQDSMQLGSTFEIHVTVAPNHTPEEVLRVVDEELERLRNEPPAAEEVLRARTDVVTGMVFSTEPVGSRADRLNMYNHYTHEADYIAHDFERYQSPGPAEIQNAVRTYLPADRRVVFLVYPTRGAPPAGRVRGAQPSNGSPGAALQPAGMPPANNPPASAQQPAPARQ